MFIPYRTYTHISGLGMRWMIKVGMVGRWVGCPLCVDVCWCIRVCISVCVYITVCIDVCGVSSLSSLLCMCGLCVWCWPGQFGIHGVVFATLSSARVQPPVGARV